jgi:hypothetical protein
VRFHYEEEVIDVMHDSLDAENVLAEVVQGCGEQLPQATR